MRSNTIILVALALVRYASGSVHSRCNVLARTETGWVCGQERAAENGARYASFRGIPYAKQPLGELRFKELQPADPWKGVLNATIEGPVCYQNNVFFGPLMAPHGTSESCITANVHVPLRALPRPGEKRTAGGLPIFVFYHGGGWACGSGDSDVYGPEFMLGRDVIVITFNYRLDVLGFLSLGTAKIPGNNGLRDAITLLRWVQRNARRFGGNPDEVTLAGESAGSNNAHWLSLSPAAKGLFKRVWLMSGTAIPGLQITAPAYAQQLATSYLESLGLSGLDYDTVHDKLVQMPIETLYNASSQLLLQSFTTFMPVQESPLPGVTAIISDDPEKMLANGNGDDIPLVAGYNSNECQSFHFRIIELNLVEKTNENPVNAVPPQLSFVLPESETEAIAENIKRKYFGDELTLDKYKKVCSDLYMAGPTLRFVRERAARGGAPVYLYKFSYEAVHSVIKQVFGIEYSGAAHIEDLNNILKVNSIPVPPSTADDNMKEWMSGLAVNFVKTGAPSLDNSWPPQAGGESLKYYDIVTPFEYNYIEVSDEDNAIGDVYDIETS